MRFVLGEYSGINGPLRELGLKALTAIRSTRAFLGGSKLLTRVVVGTLGFFLIISFWPSQFPGFPLQSEYFKVLMWKPDDADREDKGGGLRIVVFGGGDVATPCKSEGQSGRQTEAWTEILCRQASPGLDCRPYLSFVPPCNDGKGAVVSNSLFTAAQHRISPYKNYPPNDSATTHLDYSWLAQHYPIPTSQDLTQQIDAFLATPRPRKPPRETLWIFSFGFWDIWNLAALPRKLAVSVIEAQIQQIFAGIEHLYQESHNNLSVAAPDTPASAAGTPPRRPPFRIFIPRPFDVSLTPGFESVRLEPPPPHNRAEQLRNAAFLTRHWDATVLALTNEWLRLPEPEAADLDALSDVRDADLLIARGAGADDQPGGLHAPLARREAVRYDVFGYVREMMVEGQLRDVDVVDSNGLGAKLADTGFSEVRGPCRSSRQPGEGGGDNATAGDGDARDPCMAVDDHLFWTEFTVSRRAIDEVGKRAAEQLRRHADMELQWLRKAGRPFR
ncbi:hypothetical protein F4779DRAFT_641349 [Xylariaceae sp. FL0662B]|nr:hypothetical protein F4779DRAFT_641349 [Xylariaceae sp. FL0662B]